jgi:ABC-type sugar transport system substrate-binding protein
MKRYLSIPIFVMLSLALAVGASAAPKKIRVGLTISARDQFLTSYENYVKDAAQKAGNMDVVSFDAQGDVQKQYEHLNTFTTQKFDVIVLIAANTDTVPEMLKMVGDIPVIVAFRFPAGSKIEDVIRPGDAYVGSQNIVAGQLQAEFLTKYFKAKGKKTINYVMLIGDLGAEVSVERTKGVLDGLRGAGFTLNKVLEDTAGWDRAKAMSMTETLLGTAKVIDTIITNNDEMALGAIEALKTTGKFPGIPVLGIDATAPGLEAIKNGSMAMTVLLDARTQAAVTVDVAAKMVNKKPFTAVNWVPYKTVTPDNVDQFMKK